MLSCQNKELYLICTSCHYRYWDRAVEKNFLRFHWRRERLECRYLTKREVAPWGVEMRAQVTENWQRQNQPTWQVEWMLNCRDKGAEAWPGWLGSYGNGAMHTNGQVRRKISFARKMNPPRKRLLRNLKLKKEF